jgi:hypothetical protein
MVCAIKIPSGIAETNSQNVPHKAVRGSGYLFAPRSNAKDADHA